MVLLPVLSDVLWGLTCISLISFNISLGFFGIALAVKSTQISVLGARHEVPD